jgi:hypothetical protein
MALPRSSILSTAKSERSGSDCDDIFAQAQEFNACLFQFVSAAMLWFLVFFANATVNRFRLITLCSKLASSQD